VTLSIQRFPYGGHVRNNRDEVVQIRVPKLSGGLKVGNDERRFLRDLNDLLGKGCAHKEAFFILVQLLARTASVGKWRRLFDVETGRDSN